MTDNEIQILHGLPHRSFMANRSSLRQGNFGWLYRNLPPWEPAPGANATSELNRLADSMRPGACTSGLRIRRRDSPNGTAAMERREHEGISAGYTYFAQFIDHDLTFDPTSVSQQIDDPELLYDFRTPAFDLDCLYGRGPRAEPLLYSEEMPWLFNIDVNQAFELDLPRLRNRGILADPRNDDFIILSQLHTRFLKFHNEVAERIRDGRRTLDPEGIFTTARQLVRWHYQWVVLHDFLPTILESRVMDRLRILVENLKTPKQTQLLHFRPHNDPYLPVEFTAAAFRFAHCMPRESYLLNEALIGTFEIEGLQPGELPAFSREKFKADDLVLDLRGRRPLPRGWGIDWRLFFPDPSAREITEPQRAMRLDSKISQPFFDVPMRGRTVSLPALDLLKGHQYGLPAGQTLARKMGIPEEEILTGSEACDLEEFQQSTPLFYYVLREAEKRGGGYKLGRLGSEIVGEVLIGLMLMDSTSFLSEQPRWRPIFGDGNSFTLFDLLTFRDKD